MFIYFYKLIQKPPPVFLYIENSLTGAEQHETVHTLCGFVFQLSVRLVVAAV